MELMEWPKTRRRSGLPPKSLFGPQTLLKLVSFFPVLWDPKRPDFKNSKKVGKVWSYIAGRFNDGTTPQECKAKWETVLSSRAKFNYRKRQQELPSGSAAPPASGRKRKEHFEYEPLLSFLPTVQGDDVTEGNVSVLDETFASGVSNFSYTSAVLNEVSEDDGPNYNSTPLRDVSHMLVCSPPLKLCVLHSSKSSCNLQEGNVDPCKGKKVKRPLNVKINLSPIVEEIDDVKPSVVIPQTCNEEMAKDLGDLQLIANPQPVKKLKLSSSVMEIHEGDGDGMVETDNEEIAKDMGRLPTKVEIKKKKQEALNAQREALRLRLKAQVMEEERRKREKNIIQAKAAASAPTTNKDPVMDLCSAIISELQQDRQENTNEHTLFCLSMASRIQKLPPHLARVATLNILQTVMEKEAEAEDILSKSKKKDTSPPSFLDSTGVDEADKLFSCPDRVPIISEFGLTILGGDIKTLCPGAWLNDQIINFYFNLIVTKWTNLYFFSSFFWEALGCKGFDGVKRWTKNVNIFEFHHCLVPINMDNHWTLIVINMIDRQIMYFDSNNDFSVGLPEKESTVLAKFLSYLQAEAKEKKVTSFDVNEWASGAVKNIPQQNNGYDCGMYVLCYALQMAKNPALLPTPFVTPEDIPVMRRKVAGEILKMQIM